MEGLHSKRASALLRATAGLLRGGITSLSAIALNLDGATRLKHRLKSVDRLLGNTALNLERHELYRYVALSWLKGLSQILIVVDWSDLTKDQRLQLLRASVVVEGRSLTLYEEVHSQKKLGNSAVHRLFLRRLATILPPGCKPIVMTDAGFHANWFKMVEAMGWEFIGRIRGRNRVRFGPEGSWVEARALYARARAQVRDLGLGYYVRSNPVEVRTVLSRRPKKGRHHLNIYGVKRAGGSSTKNARGAREPWLLASSLGLRHLSAQAIVGLYAQRMGIEQSFRDTKNLQRGFGLEAARSRSGQRMEILLLLTHLASFVQRLIGESARQHQLELQFMAQRRSHRPEISVLTLGRRILDASPSYLDELFPWRAIRPLTKQAARPCATFTF
jgi:ribosomal protein L34